MNIIQQFYMEGFIDIFFFNKNRNKSFKIKIK
jgi:hypothetical protein